MVRVEPALPPATLFSEDLRDTADQAAAFAAQAKSTNTLRAYRADWTDFTTWCAGHALGPLPAAPETVALYLAALVARGRKVSTITRRLSAISQAHQLAGHDPSPTSSLRVRLVLAGIRRARGSAEEGKAPVGVEDLRAMVAKVPREGLRGARDRALLLVGFAGAFRRSELVGLDVADLAFERAGVVITLRRSKTDQAGVGRKVAIPLGGRAATCPVRALEAWLKAAAIVAGPVFRAINRHGQLAQTRLGDSAVAAAVKCYAEAAGLDPARFAGHSLRAGFATAAAAAGVEEHAIMSQTGHRSLTMLRRYIRDGSLFRTNAAGRIGL